MILLEHLYTMEWHPRSPNLLKRLFFRNQMRFLNGRILSVLGSILILWLWFTVKTFGWGLILNHPPSPRSSRRKDGISNEFLSDRAAISWSPNGTTWPRKTLEPRRDHYTHLSRYWSGKRSSLNERNRNKDIETDLMIYQHETKVAILADQEWNRHQHDEALKRFWKREERFAGQPCSVWILSGRTPKRFGFEDSALQRWKTS